MIWLAPWLRGPVLLLRRRPAVAVALLAAAVVAAVPAAACPMFLSSASTAAFYGRADGACPWTLGSQVSGGLLLGPGEDAAGYMWKRTTAEANAAASTPRLGPAATTLYRDDLILTASAGQAVPTAVMLVSRSGFPGQVSVVGGPRGSGLWLPDGLASLLRLHIGDWVQLTAPTGGWGRLGPDGRPVPVEVQPFDMTVSAIYADLRSAPDSSYWCSSRQLYRGKSGQDSSDQAVLDMVLTDQSTFLDLIHEAGVRADHSGFVIERQVDIDHLPQAQLQRVGDDIAAVQHDMTALTSPGGALGSQTDHPTVLRSDLRSYAQRAGLVGRSLRPVTLAMSLAGLCVGLLVLAAHGVGAGALGVKAALEAVLPLAAGTAIGWLLAWLLVRMVGPSALIDPAAMRMGGIAATGVLAAALVVTIVTAGVGSRRLTDQAPQPRHRVRLLAWTPWEVLLLSAAVLAWLRSSGGHITSLGNDATFGQVASLPVRLLVAPLLVVAGAVLLCARLAALWLRHGQARGAPKSPVWLLTWRRISRETLAACVLAGATAAPVALAIFGAAVAQSTSGTLSAQAKLAVGADTVITLTKPAVIPASLAGRATQVRRLDGAQLGGITVSLLEIDAATFPRAAYWDDRIEGHSLASIVVPLRPAGPDGSGAVVVAGAPVPEGTQEMSTASADTLAVQVRTVQVLPAEQGGYPTVLVARGVLDRLGLTTRSETQLWVRGDPAQIHRAALAAHLPISQFTDATAVYRHTWIEPVTYTFDYLTAVCLLAGLVTVVGLVLYLEAGTPTRRRAWVLLRRMGLRTRQHRWSMLAQIAIPVGYGLLVGLGLATVLTLATQGDMDIRHDQPPRTLLSTPVAALVEITVAVALVVAMAVGVAQARTMRAHPSEVLRDVD